MEPEENGISTMLSAPPSVRQSQVELGILGAWILIVASCLVTLVDRWRGDISGDYFMGTMIFYGVVCVLPYMLQQRKNWARYVYAVMTVIEVLAVLGGAGDENITRLDTICGWVLTPLSIWTAWTLFSPSGKAWFRSGTWSRTAEDPLGGAGSGTQQKSDAAGDASLVKTAWLVIGVGMFVMLIPIPGTGMVGAALSGGAGAVLAIINMVRRQVGQGIAQLVVACVGTGLFYAMGAAIFAGALLSSLNAH